MPRLLPMLASCLLLAACKTEPGVPAVCHESIQRGTQLAGVGDAVSARDWLAQAKKQCGATPPRELAELEQQLEAAEQRQADLEKRRRAEAPPRPPSQSLVPAFLAAVTRYRDTKGREKCGEERCDDVAHAGELTVQLWTKPRDAATYAAFAVFPGERVGCEQLGRAEVKRAWKLGAVSKAHCVVTDGALQGLSVLVQQRTDKAETDVTVFAPRWVGFDPALDQELREAETQ